MKKNKYVKDRVKRSLASTIQIFEEGNDREALQEFIHFIVDLESILSDFETYEQTKEQRDALLDMLKELLRFMENEDILQMTEFLKESAQPLLDQFVKGCEGE